MDLFDDLPEPEPLPANWDPEMHERQYFRHSHTGDLGWLVRRDGETHIKYDTTAQDRTQPFRQAEWKEENRPFPITEAHVAMVCFEADKPLCRALGKHQLSRKDWSSMPDEQRLLWMRVGPSDPPLRAELWRAIQGVLKKAKV